MIPRAYKQHTVGTQTRAAERLLAVVLLAFCCLACSSRGQEMPQLVHVLFIGNSLTSVGDIPGTIQALANNANDGFICDASAISSQSLEYQLSSVDLGIIEWGNYNYVVLQEQSRWPTVPANRDNDMYPAIRALNQRITNANARTILYETWGYPYGDSYCSTYDIPPALNKCDETSMEIAVRKGYAGIANELGVEISPVGLAWMTAHSERPKLALSPSGDYHPNANGAYLAACVHYAALTGRSPVSNSYIGLVGIRSDATYLQMLAERTVLNDPWAVDSWGYASNRFYWASTWSNFLAKNGVQAGSESSLTISGAAAVPSPSVLLNEEAGVFCDVNLGVYDPLYGMAGEGRLFIRGKSGIGASRLVVGREGKGWVTQDAGTVELGEALILGDARGSCGSYALRGGVLSAPKIAPAWARLIFHSQTAN